MRWDTLTTLCFFIGCPLVAGASHAQSAWRAVPGERRPVLVAEPRVLPAGVATFSEASAVVDFEGAAPGTPVGGQYAGQGVAGLTLANGLSPEVWMDGDHALRNAVEPGASASGALWIDFEPPVNRAGFEIRATGSRPLGSRASSAGGRQPGRELGARGRGHHVNLLLTCYRNGVAVGQPVFFDVDDAYRFVGVQATAPFDRLAVTTTNPPDQAFSIDDLRCELDLTDTDLDGVADFGDRCPLVYDPEQPDADADGLGDACDPFPLDPSNDADGDGIGEEHDNCPVTFNPGQEDADGDGIGDACDTVPFGIDTDGDGIEDPLDNCVFTPNPGQEDCDEDGIGDVCDFQLVNPPTLDLELRPGECVDVVSQVCLPAVPPVIDLLITVDTTGSMGGEIDLLRREITTFVQDMRRLTGSNVAFGLVHYRDYPSSYSSCGYSKTYGRPADFAFEVVEPIGATDDEILAGVSSLVAGGGFDGPESYTRVLWETSQLDSGIGFRFGAARIVVDFNDNIPHDCDIGFNLPPSCVPITTGLDPGRDEALFTADDVDLHTDALLQIFLNATKVFTFHSGEDACAWESFTSITQGNVQQINRNGTLPPGVDLAQVVFDTLSDVQIGQVRYVLADPGGPLDITFSPPAFGPVNILTDPEHTVFETICVPPGTPDGVYSNIMGVLTDNILVAVQLIDVRVSACETMDFEGFANGHQITAADFAVEGITVTSSGAGTFGAAVFDSDVGGANDPGADPDLLVDLGGVLILQEDPTQTVPGVFDFPDDAEVGGSFVLDFAEPVELRSIDLVDVDAPMPMQGVDLRLVDGAGRTRAFTVPQEWTEDVTIDGPPGYGTLDLTDLGPQPGFRSTATASQEPGFDPQGVVRLEIELLSSGAIDNLVLCAQE